MIGSRPLSDNEIELIVNSLPSLRDKCLFTLGVKTGFRISELLSLKLSEMKQYGVVKNEITVKRAKMKGKIRTRSVPLAPPTHTILKAYVATLPTGQKYLFESKKGLRLSRHQAWRVIKEAAEANKLGGNISTHSMRKTFAFKIYNKLGKDIFKTQKALGHVSVLSTVSYLFFSSTEIDEAILEI